ncbi:hypothetical protein F2Q70_00020285 [Brassica cretica]|uniref:Protein kinase domain-containing protein n=1 Tax=Brassica cretica TaxID=69181 RepID=A0A8S9GNX7_BRACR|nr:hypothetical protein F2Q70_00020285 [Brassica cretica]
MASSAASPSLSLLSLTSKPPPSSFSSASATHRLFPSFRTNGGFAPLTLNPRRGRSIIVKVDDGDADGGGQDEYDMDDEEVEEVDNKKDYDVEYDPLAAAMAAASGGGGDGDIAFVQSKSFISTQGWDSEMVVDYRINEDEFHKISLLDCDFFIRKPPDPDNDVYDFREMRSERNGSSGKQSCSCGLARSYGGWMQRKRHGGAKSCGSGGEDVAVATVKEVRQWRCKKKIPVAQWVLKLPSRTNSAVGSSDTKQIGFDFSESEDDNNKLSSLNAEGPAIVPDGNDSVIVKCSPDNSPEELEGLHERVSTSCQSFKYNELVSVTSNFCPDNFIGKGGSSKVYRGHLPNGREVAVKILKQTKGVLNDFVAEIEIITALNHKNVISLLGYCFENSSLLLVYNYLSRGSLEENLHGNKRDSVAFGWNERYKVAVGIAEALDYLHNSAPQAVIHRDVKSSNILLSDDFEPQLSDFGLAKWASASTTQTICSDVSGTFGYLAPEYFMYGKMNDKIDVYAYGVVLLELLSGRKPINSESPKARESLVMWAKPILDDRDYSQLLDPSLLDDNDGDQMERMALAATLCIRNNPQSRPDMGMVLNLLKGDMEKLKWAKEEVSIGLEDSKLLKDAKLDRSNLQSHLNLAFLDMEDDAHSMVSMDQGISVEDYLKGRESRSSSFN